jgi:hypothetical protein
MPRTWPANPVMTLAVSFSHNQDPERKWSVATHSDAAIRCGEHPERLVSAHFVQYLGDGVLPNANKQGLLHPPNC